MATMDFKKFHASNLQADSSIESGKPLKEIVPMFPSKTFAYQYFATAMTRRFSIAEPCCANCGVPCETSPLAFTWHANIHTKKTILLSFLFTALAILAQNLYSRWVVIEFITLHRLCPACRKIHRNRRILVAVFRKALFAVLMLMLFLTVPAVIFTFMAIFAAPETTLLFFGLAAGGLVMLGLVTWGFEGCRRLLIPKSLLQIGRFPFGLEQIREI